MFSDPRKLPFKSRLINNFSIEHCNDGNILEFYYRKAGVVSENAGSGQYQEFEQNSAQLGHILAWLGPANTTVPYQR